MPRNQVVEHRSGRADDARSRELDGRLWHHRRLSGIPRQQVDGCAVGSNVRGARSGAASAALVNYGEPAFPSAVPGLDPEIREIAADRPGTGACMLATAMGMWLWTLEHLQRSTDADGDRLYQSARQGVTFPLADALCWLLASRYQILDA